MIAHLLVVGSCDDQEVIGVVLSGREAAAEIAAAITARRADLDLQIPLELVPVRVVPRPVFTVAEMGPPPPDSPRRSSPTASG